MSKITLSWVNLSNIHTSQKVYKSLTNFDSSTLPVALATLPKGDRSYVDNDVIAGLSYYYAVSTVSDSGELVSSVKKVDAVLGDDGDVYWDDVSSLLHLDSNFLDQKPITWVGSGSPTIVTDTKHFGAGSLRMIGSQKLSASSDNFKFGTGDYTIECFYKPDSLNKAIINWNGGNKTLYLWSGGWSYFDGSVNAITGGVVSYSTFTHLALVRNSGAMSLFVGGVLVDSATDTFDITSGDLNLGIINPSNPSGGWWDEVRITKGVARYTTSFTPPTEPFPNY